MSWDSLVIVDDVDIGRFEPEAIAPSTPWGAASWPTQIEQAKRTLRAWIDADYGHIVGASDRIRDRYAFGHVKGYTGSSFTDYLPEATDDTEEDIPLASIYATPGSDFIYCGARFAYTGVFVHLLDSVNANSSTLTVAYWAKNQWQSAPSQSDGTAVSGATFGQSARVIWARITDWERRSLDGSDENYYWIRLSVSASLTSGTAASQIAAIRHPETLRTIAAWLSLSYILNGLALQSAEPEEWRTRAQEYRSDARELYDSAKANGMLSIDSDASGVVEPSEVGEAASIKPGRMLRA